MLEIQIWAIIAMSFLTLLFSIIIIYRSKGKESNVGKEVRDELRAGREESRISGKELREEVTNSLKLYTDSISQMLESFTKFQQTQLESMTKQLKVMSESNRDSLESIRTTFDSRVKELQESNEKKLNDMRNEVSDGLKVTSDTVSKALDVAAKNQQSQLESMTKNIKELTNSNQISLDAIRTTFDNRFKELQDSNEKKLVEMRKEASDGLKNTSDTISKTLDTSGKSQQNQLENMTKQLKEFADANHLAMDRIRNTFDLRIKELQEGNEKKLSEIRKDASDGLKNSSDTISKTLEATGKSQQNQLEGMNKQLKEISELNQASLERIRTTFDTRVKELQSGNEKKLDEMRKTVDEKLHDTLEKRLGESFKLVSDRLEAVHKGLGEMQSLASGVGDLKRVLTNVKARGTWAEVQLGALLEQILTPEQYAKNVSVKEGGSERVEYAIRLPGSKVDPDSHVWLPIDSKFPQEDYLRLQDAAEKADSVGVQTAADALGKSIRASAKDIYEKYISPPDTTDFAILFLATEGLYAEVLRQPTLVDELHQKYRIVLAGPTTLVAILNSLRIGFQTLAIEKRTSEVWRVLGAVKTEFGKFGTVLEKVKKQINTVSKTIDETGQRSRAIEKQLRTVEQLPESDVSSILVLPENDDIVNRDEIA